MPIEAAAFYLVCLLAACPLWLVTRPPLQDLPQHLGATRVLLDHGNAAYGMIGAVKLNLGETQYLAFYLAAAPLAALFGPLFATKLLLSGVLIGTPWALRALLGATQRDRRLAWFALPLTYNAHVVLGFLNFLAAIPLALCALAMAARLPEQRSYARSALLAATLVVIFYLHIVPFAFAMLGASALLLEPRKLRATATNLLTLAPALLLAGWWTYRSPAGESTLTAVMSGLGVEESPLSRFDPLRKTLLEWPEWLTDVLPGSGDLTLLAIWLAVFVVAWCLMAASREPAVSSRLPGARWLGALAAVALVSSIELPYQHDWIWPIAGRFPYLALLFSPLLFARGLGHRGRYIWPLLAALSLAHITMTARAFTQYERHEAEGFEGALASVPRGSSVVGLIYNPDSRYVSQHPFMHFVGHVQSEKGGIVDFSFGRIRQSPFRYEGPNAPPPLQMGFGWSPQASEPNLIARFYEYALVRGDSPHLRRIARNFTRVFQQNEWSVWMRRKRE